jgi:hypothetical protein
MHIVFSMRISAMCMFNYYSSGDQAFVFLIIYYIILHTIVEFHSVDSKVNR